MKVFNLTDVNLDIQSSRKYIFFLFQIMNQLPENSLRDVTSVTYLIGLIRGMDVSKKYKISVQYLLNYGSKAMDREDMGLL